MRNASRSSGRGRSAPAPADLPIDPSLPRPPVMPVGTRPGPALDPWGRPVRAEARRSPSRVPRRGLAAVALTAGSLALLLSFRGPEDDLLLPVGLPVGDGEIAFAPDPSSDPFAAADPTAEPLPAETAAPTEPPAPTKGPVYGPPAPGATPEPTPAPTQRPTPKPTAKPAGRTASASASDGTWKGAAVPFRYGTVQVAITVANGEIVSIDELQMPDRDRHSAQISRVAAPMLRKMALNAQSARIDVLSGATYTSLAYRKSLQSAIDQAGI